MRRRAFLAGATAGAVALAGCLGGGDTADGGGDGGTATGTGTGTGTATPSANNALRGLADQPALGPDPGEAEGLIVAFEDPSCPTCARFERETVPEIRSKLVEPGKAAYVFRGYPVIYPWGEPATHALEATYARDAGAFWTLAAHYFESQDEFRGSDAETVRSKTATFLNDNTDVDGDAVAGEAGGEAAAAAVGADLDAGMAAGAGRRTPSIFLFKNGEYRTNLAGSVSYNVIASALNL
jgi:hypothetical protein